LYHFSGKWQHVAPVGIDCPGQASVRYRVKGVTLHPNGRVRRRWCSPEFERHSPNPSPTDFYVHLNIARCLFSRSKYFEQPRKALALAGGGIPSEVGNPFKPAVLCLEAATYAVNPLNPK